jgi:hypothetical protein
MSIENKGEDEMAPVFLELGKALFTCQSLEVNLRALNAQLSNIENESEESTFGSSWDLFSNETLGQLINALRKRIDIPADLSDYFEAGLKIRNEIVHDSMTRNMQRCSSPDGRLEVAAELAAMKQEVEKRNILVNKLLKTRSTRNICAKNFAMKAALSPAKENRFGIMIQYTCPREPVAL